MRLWLHLLATPTNTLLVNIRDKVNLWDDVSELICVLFLDRGRNPKIWRGGEKDLKAQSWKTRQYIQHNLFSEMSSRNAQMCKTVFKKTHRLILHKRYVRMAAA